jgi:magnesium-transporting ATPase (P-type)
VSDRSFVRFGGLAGILLALTSWAAVFAYYNAANAGQDLVQLESVQLLHALVGFWAMFAVVAVHWVARRQGEAWSLFTALVGVMAAVLIVISSLYPIAFTRNLLRQPIDVAQPLPTSVTATDPLSVVTFGITGLWFLLANLLLWRAPVSRRLALLGFAAAIDLVAGFLAVLSAQGSLATSAAVIAGAFVGPIYWLWLGITLRRIA